MTFNPNIPAPGDFLSNSQGQLLNNNIALDASFENDHTKFSDTTANNGFHKKVTLYQAAADPTLTFPQTELYTKNSGTTPNQITNLFYATKPETGAISYLQMTGLTSTQFLNGGAGGGNGYYIRTPWGMIILWGKTANAVQYSGVNFPFNLVNNTYALQLTIIGETQPLEELTKTISGFTTKGTSIPGTFDWLVLVSS